MIQVGCSACCNELSFSGAGGASMSRLLKGNGCLAWPWSIPQAPTYLTTGYGNAFFSRENCGWFITLPHSNGNFCRGIHRGASRGASLLHELPDPFVHPLHHGAPRLLILQHLQPCARLQNGRSRGWPRQFGA